jgi:cytochrome c oxidase subunit 3
MSTAELAASDWKLPSPRKAGIACLILTESALFTIFVVAYLFYVGKSLNGPYPSQVLEFPLIATIALLSSSFPIYLAEKMLHRGNHRGFLLLWGITIALGAYFLGFTALEWKHLIFNERLTISTNVFGSTFYSLVGLHASHVIIGLILLSLVFILTLLGKIPSDHKEHIAMISWYWHFVDAIWVVVVFVVYVFSVRYQ